LNPTQPLPGTTPPPNPYGGPPPTGGSGGGGNDQWPIYVAIGCVMIGLFCMCGVGVSGLVLFLSGSGSFGGLRPATTVHVRATVTQYLGLGAGIGQGTTCDLPITQQTSQDGTSLCHVVMTCGGQALYGDTQQGFFPCQFSTSPPRVIGQDSATSMDDHDGAFSIDTTQNTISLADDFMGRSGMFVLSANITSVTAE
jgi:hypothetical protein